MTISLSTRERGRGEPWEMELRSDEGHGGSCSKHKAQGEAVTFVGRQVHDRRNSGVYEAHRVYKRSCMARIPSTTGDGLEIRVTTGLL